MRLSSQALPYQFRRNPLVTAGFLVFALFAAYELSQYILSEDTTTLLLIALAFVACGIVVAILKNWRTGVYLFLTWLLFEDFARKFLGNNMAIYFAKDILAIVVFISFFAAYRRKQVQHTFKPPFLVPLFVLVWFGFLQIFNFASTSFAFGLLGLKLYFFYIPLIFIGYSMLNSESDLRRFFFVNIGLALAIAALGIAQAILGHTFLNPEVAADDLRELSTLYRTAPITGAIIYRPTSVFVSDGRFGSYMIFAWLITFGVIGYLLLRNRQGRTFGTLCLAVMTVAVVLTGSRGALLWTGGSAAVSTVAFLWGGPWRQRGLTRILRTIQRAVLFGALALILLFIFNPDALLSRYAFYWETLSFSSPQSELVYRARDYPLQNFMNAFQYPRWPYGYGIGTASLGVQYVGRFFHVAAPVAGTENGYGTLIVELGIVGLALWIIMTVAVIVSCWKVVSKLKGSPWFPLAFVIFWYAFLLLVPLSFSGIVSYQNFVQNAYLWLLIGILFRMPKIAVSSQFSVPEADGQVPGRWIR
jgi:hypothetical protein